MNPFERLRSAEVALAEAHSLVRAQEAEVIRMKLAGVDVGHAETLLRAYKEGARLAEEQVFFVRRSLW
jgi:hypothetical protein